MVSRTPANRAKSRLRVNDSNALLDCKALQVVMASGSPLVIAEGQFKLTFIKPTVFVVRQEDVLTQLGEAMIDNVSEKEVEITLQFQIAGKRMQEVRATVPKGTTSVKFSLPEISEPIPVTFVLTAEGREHDRHSMTWQPQKKWDIYFVPITHHDLGYTDTIESVLNRYADFYDDILRF